MKSYFANAGMGLASRTGGYLREGPGGINLERLLVYGALIGLGYLVYKTSKAVGDVKGALNNVGSAVGSGLYDLFHPNAAQRATSTSLIVWFPAENAFHAVDSLDVSSAGAFARNGVKYAIVAPKAKTKAPDGREINKIAVRA